MNKILCIGEALIDMICTDRGMALADGEHFLKKAGGAPMNVAAAIGALGGNVAVAAKVGDDPFGQHLVEGSNGILVLAREVLLIPLFKKAFARPKQEQRKKSQRRKNGFHRSASEV